MRSLFLLRFNNRQRLPLDVMILKVAENIPQISLNGISCANNETKSGVTVKHSDFYFIFGSDSISDSTKHVLPLTFIDVKIY